MYVPDSVGPAGAKGAVVDAQLVRAGGEDDGAVAADPPLARDLVRREPALVGSQAFDAAPFVFARDFRIDTKAWLARVRLGVSRLLENTGAAEKALSLFVVLVAEGLLALVDGALNRRGEFVVGLVVVAWGTREREHGLVGPWAALAFAAEELVRLVDLPGLGGPRVTYAGPVVTVANEPGLYRIGHGVGDFADDIGGLLARDLAALLIGPHALEFSMTGVDGARDGGVAVALKVDDSRVRIVNHKMPVVAHGDHR